MARWRPLTDRQWAAPLIQGLGRLAIAAGIATYLVVLGLVLAVTRRAPDDPLVETVAILATLVVTAAVARLLVDRDVRPAFEVLEWTQAYARARWGGLGWPDGIPQPEPGLAWLGDRADDDAMAARSVLLATLGRTAELSALLASWTPLTETGLATKARQLATLDALRGGEGRIDAAIEAADRIPDPAARTAALALVHVDAATRAGGRGLSPIPELGQAHRILGAEAGTPPPRTSRALRVLFASIVVVGIAVPVAVAALLGAGIPGMAAWVAALAVYVIGLLLVARRRR